MVIDQEIELYGVVGYPLGHSMSPAMHNAAFSVYGKNALYLAFQTRDLEGCIRGIRALGIRGVSVTIPYKSAVVPLLDEVDGLAKRIGAINTIINNQGCLVGYNTDALGALMTLEEKIELSGKTCLIIGAGGAARAIGFILKDYGIRLNISNRSSRRGEDLSDALGCPFVPLDKVKDLQVDLLVQATPVGMYPYADQCIVPPDVLREGMVVMDVIYNPRETRLLAMARDRGCLAIDGLGMFIQQGAEQFMLWTGLEAPVSIMRQAVEETLKKNS
jgi:shikimate dehydrogenase